MLPCDPQDRPPEGLVPRGPAVPSLGGPPPCRPGSGKMTVVANSTEPSCWSLTRNHTQFPCLFLSGFPLWSPDVVHPLGPERSQADLGEGGWGGQGSGLVPPPPWRQAAGLLAVPQLLREPGQPCLFLSCQLPTSPPSAGTSVCSGHVAPSPPREALSPDAHSFGLQSSGSGSPRAPEL